MGKNKGKSNLEDAVEKSHQKMGVKCEWIMEVKETADGGMLLWSMVMTSK